MKKLFSHGYTGLVTGLVWQWILNPEFGIQGIVRSWGWESFAFDPLNNPDTVLYGLLIAGLWQGTGFVMCLMLAGLRGIDEDIWKAAAGAIRQCLTIGAIPAKSVKGLSFDATCSLVALGEVQHLLDHGALDLAQYQVLQVTGRLVADVVQVKAHGAAHTVAQGLGTIDPLDGKGVQGHTGVLCQQAVHAA